MVKKIQAGSAAKALLVRRYAPADAHIPRHLGGGILKEFAESEAHTGRLLRYCLAYINPVIFAGDNAHGFAHRHFMGQVTFEPDLTWDEIHEKFEREWRAIALEFIGGTP